MTTSTNCPIPVGHARPVPSNPIALSTSRHLMKKYPGTTFGAAKHGKQWVAVRYA